ncbi:MAG: M48 family metalloprotease, partial [Candidatus Heimdallarchaeota archaeon]
MPLNHLLLNTKIKMHLSNGFFLFLNAVHLFIASTLTISPKDEGLVRFHFSWLVQFQWQRLLIAFILLLIQVIITYLVLWWRFRQAKLIQITEFGLVGENHFLIKNSLRLDPKDIYKMVIDLAREFKLKSIKRVYLSNTNIPNALTIDVVPLPFLRSSWIVLDANIIEILDKKEIKAIIAHELAHIKKLDSIVNIYRFGINYFVFVAYSLQLLQMIYIIIADEPEVWNIVLRIALLLLLILAMWFLTIINRWLMNFSRQQAELLA